MSLFSYFILPEKHGLNLTFGPYRSIDIDLGLASRGYGSVIEILDTDCHHATNPAKCSRRIGEFVSTTLVESQKLGVLVTWGTLADGSSLGPPIKISKKDFLELCVTGLEENQLYFVNSF